MIGATKHTWLEKRLIRFFLGTALGRKLQRKVDSPFIRGGSTVQTERKVYVSGLARAGTTSLLNILASTESFATLRYADVPYLLAPRLAMKMRTFVSEGETFQRAHGDGISINQMSPEALEEPFWIDALPEQYEGTAPLAMQEVTKEVYSEYARFIRGICETQGKNYYLAKNNNYILRISDCLTLDHTARVVLVVRDPKSHSLSLQRQHLRFQQADPFQVEYMKMLGHFEFGPHHRPFSLPGRRAVMDSTDSIAYWENLWLEYYSYVHTLLSDFGKSIFLAFHDELGSPELLVRLSEFLEIDLTGARDDNYSLRSGSPAQEEACPLNTQLYEQLRACRRGANF